ncbi:hypothetical protein N825_32155 [Skermanella stibiiresistens SB22]|uniref:Uncharacterized protein n=1 Tax=Skermanella stibiiresistens SB22 TaxID=1385369 RepID=W9GPY3_9PROT|nr:hypothetical protein [Skermanella stibiiresistens]EWY35955.1 hypothetical protein N825_32155 [Skermanella stibiiresistens SB22]
MGIAMGMSAFKLFLILAVVGVLFLPTLIRRSRGLPAILERLRARVSGERPTGTGHATASASFGGRDAKPSMAERLGAALARLDSRVRSRKG